MTPADFQSLTGWTAARCAVELGVHRITWHRWCTGAATPPGRLLELALAMLWVDWKRDTEGDEET